MLTIVLTGALLLASPSPPPDVEQPPATRLALELAETWGTRVDALNLAFEKLSSADQAATTAAIAQTQLFALSRDAIHTLTVRRIDPNSVLVVLAETSSPSRLWVSQFSWPTAAAQEAKVAREQDYARRSVRIEAFNRATAVGVSLGARLGHPIGYTRRPSHLQLAGATPLVLRPELDWRIIRGTATVIDELELAKLSGDGDLEEKINHTRAQRRRLWWLSFGSGALMGVTSGVIINQRAGPPTEDNLSQRTLGTSLIALGVAAGITAMFYPSTDERHVMTAEQAQEVCDRVNRMLRQEHTSPEHGKTPGIAP